MAEYKGILNPVPKNKGGYENYSTTEHEIGTWIDGSKLYEKTIQCGQLRSSAGDMAIPHNISNLDKFVYIQGVARKNDKQTITIPVTAVDSLTNQIVCYADSTYIHIYVASDQSSRTSSEITIRYTKTP